jgi:hypothetical protein
MQPFQTSIDASRKSGGQDRGRKGIGFMRAVPGGLPQTLAKIKIPTIVIKGGVCRGNAVGNI